MGYAFNAMILVLGSQSPRRQEILGYFSLPFKVAAPPFNEKEVPFDGDPEWYSCAVASGKALSLRETFPDAAILAADTVVFREGKLYEKPRDREEAFQFLKELCGQWHTVYTGISLVHGEDEFHCAETTRVLFNPLSDKQIDTYLGAINWSDKSGSYTIQQTGSLVINRIEGCYYNVIGFPVNSVQSLLKNIGLDLWQHLS